MTAIKLNAVVPACIESSLSIFCGPAGAVRVPGGWVIARPPIQARGAKQSLGSVGERRLSLSEGYKVECPASAWDQFLKSRSDFKPE